MKVECSVCHVVGYLQRIGKNYYRVRHYQGIDRVSKISKFTYHQQSKEYIQGLHIDSSTHSNIDHLGSRTIDHLPNTIDLKLNSSSSVSDNKVCLDSSAGQSDSLVSCRSRVRIPPEAPFCTRPERAFCINVLIRQ